jgi:hypothetical protein
VKRILTLVGAIATLAAGATAAVALGAGTSSHDTATGATTTTTAADTATGATTMTTAADTTIGPTTAVTPGATTTTTAGTGPKTAVVAGPTTSTASSKVWVCHHTGSWKHPYHLIHISTHALPAHMRHGDVTPGADNSCPTTQPAGTKVHGRGNGQSNKAKTKDDNPGKGDDKTESNDD